MKRNLIAAIAFVLIIAHIIPPNNISFANDESNDCELMDFTVQTIKENDEKIKGTAQPSQQLEIEFKTKNKSETVDVDANSNFEINVEEEFLEVNDEVMISNEYFKVETKVVSADEVVGAIQSTQYIECPKLEVSAEVEVVEEGSTKEGELLESDVGEEIDEESLEEEQPSKSDVGEVINEESLEEEQPSKSDVGEVINEEPLEEEQPSKSDVGEEIDEEPLEEEQPSKSDVGKVINEEPLEEEQSSKSDVGEVINEEPLEDKLQSEEVDEVLVIKKIEESSRLLSNSPSGLLDADLLSEATLQAEHIEKNNGKHEITLTYIGEGALRLGLLSNLYSNFYIPSEIASEITNLSATYDVPMLGLLGIVLRNTGTFDEGDINTNIDNNHIHLNFFNLLSLTLLSSSHYTFELTIELDELPPTKSGEYIFYSATNNQLLDVSLISEENTATARLVAPKSPKTPVIDAPVYTTDSEIKGTGEPNATIIIRIGNQEYRGQVDSSGNFSVTIPPQNLGTEIRGVIESEEGYESIETSVTVVERLDSPVVDSVYSNNTVVTGTGVANTNVILTIDDNTYEGEVDEGGNFAVMIPEQRPGTVISAVLVEVDSGIMSESVEVTVLEATVSFHNVPDSISFNTTKIESVSSLNRIPRQNPDWKMEVIDTRGNGSEFSILAEVQEPLSNESRTHNLPNALVYVDENSQSHSLYGDAVKVHSGVTGNNQISEISWAANRGLMVEVNPLLVQPESYDTTINWTLSNGP